MRFFLLSFVVLSLAACSKDPELSNPPAAIDTLGVGWKMIQLPTSDFVNDIFFINNSTGFCIAGKSVFRSTDGGENWQKVYQSENTLWNLAMGNANNVVITSLAADRILITRNGGNSFDSASSLKAHRISADHE